MSSRATETILVVDDELNICRVLQGMLVREGYNVLLSDSGKKALDLARTNIIDVLITDMIMPDINGVELLCRVKQIHPDATALVITAYPTIRTTVEAMRNGAYNFLTKPFDLEEVRLTIKNALENRELKAANRRLTADAQRTYRFDSMIGSSPAMQEVYQTLKRATEGTVTVLIRGESGTGKELIARALHYQGPRANKPFIAVACAALPETLLESELFGHEKNAFTGANSMRVGRFELAHEGTLFLDEVAEISPSVQVKLLRAIQEREFERIGGTKTIQVDVRIISATNKDLEKALADRSFREDLYYRLDVVSIFVPPLRERRSDIPDMVEHFLQRFNQKSNRQIKTVSAGFMDALMKYNWPGNVRQLENLIEKVVALSDQDAEIITEEALPTIIRNYSGD